MLPQMILKIFISTNVIVIDIISTIEINKSESLQGKCSLIHKIYIIHLKI